MFYLELSAAAAASGLPDQSAAAAAAFHCLSTFALLLTKDNGIAVTQTT